MGRGPAITLAEAHHHHRGPRQSRDDTPQRGGVAQVSSGTTWLFAPGRIVPRITVLIVLLLHNHECRPCGHPHRHVRPRPGGRDRRGARHSGGGGRPRVRQLLRHHHPWGRRDGTARERHEGPSARPGRLDHRSAGVHSRGLGPRPAARAAVPPDRAGPGRRLLQPRSVRLPRTRRAERAGPPLRGRRRRPDRAGHRARLPVPFQRLSRSGRREPAAATCSTSPRPTGPDI